MAERREVAAVVVLAILRYVSRAAGPAEAEAVRIHAGEPRAMSELMERGAWSSLATTLAVAREATRVTGDVQIGRRGGEELFRIIKEIGRADLIRSTGSVERALEFVIAASSQVSVGRLMTIVDRADGRLTVECRHAETATFGALFCDFAAGYWSSIPTIFGAAGYAVQLECTSRGDARCLTQVSWVDEPVDSTVDVASAASRADEMLFRYEELQQIATDVITAEDVPAVLDLVVQRAGHAVLAPRFLLAVDLRDGVGLRVHHLGFLDDESARRAALAVGLGEAHASTLVVDVATKRERYGCLAAFYAEGAAGTELDRRLMAAYAAHVAAALEAIAAFDQARQDRDTAHALLDLSRRLAGAVSVADVAQRLTGALQVVADGCRATVYLWNPETRRLRLEACAPHDDTSMVPREMVVDEVEGLSELVGSGQPLFLDADVATGHLRDLMRSTGAQQIVSLPIVARGDLLGLVSASFDRRLGDEERVLLTGRLSGFADQAATAFDNARLIERANHQATHDVLTGLANRPMLEDRVTQALLRSRRQSGHVGMLFVDLDRFKNVNDTLGHRAGDDLIRLVAERLPQELRESDTLARLGGDEFVVLLPDVTDEAGAVAVAARLVAAFTRPFSVAGRDVFISCSIGIAVSPDAGCDYETLLQHADAAMYRAKSAGANAYAVHAGAPDTAHPGQPVSQRLELESALHTAVNNSQLRVLYQPQVELASGRIVGAEALVRWEHPTFGTIGPDVFIPIAEDSGLILEIDRWVRRTALAQARAWQDAGFPPLRMSVNLSTRELRNPALPVQLAADIAAAGVEPGLVELEITERVVMMESEDLVDILDALHATGVRLAIDDFGTGSSVLGRLQRHPVDTLKIDRSFIGAISSPSSAAVVKALLQMGDSLGIEVVAEGVETEAQRAVLASLGCPLMQGYLFSPPINATAFEDLLAGSGVGTLV